MLTSKEVIRLSGISRATLNNYITLGILPRPLVQRADGKGERAPRIGYFPPQTVQRIEEVQRLKHEGYSIANIAARFRSEQPEAPGKAPVDTAADIVTPRRPERELRVTVADIPGPAYMVNDNFELVWWNESAMRLIFGISGGLQGEIEARNVFRLLLAAQTFSKGADREDILGFHMDLAKKRLPRDGLAKIYTLVGRRDAQLLERLYDSATPLEQRPLAHRRFDIGQPSGQAAWCDIYASHFREGILFVYLHAEAERETLLDLLSRRERVIRDLLKNRMPFLTNVAVLVADLQNSVQICAELPPEEYFALINHIWKASEPVFRNYYGTHGKHVGDGMVYYFFPQPDCSYVLNAIDCAHELKAVMREVSREWQGRKNWLNELYLNSGLNEGQEWFGTYHSATNIEFTVLGDTINHAARVSDFARMGSIWVTKNMLGALDPEQRQRVRFGIRRRTQRGDEVLVSNLYARISSMVDLSDGKNTKFRDIATLAVTEVVDVTKDKEAAPTFPGVEVERAPVPTFDSPWRH